MHELIFRFLLDSGFPRGAILADANGEGTQASYHPTFLIVDPQSADTLAVIEVVESGTREELSSHALHAGRFASRIVPGGVPAFVIQVDGDNANAAEQVRFYKLLAGKKMQQISSFAFPDLQALQVAQKIKNKSQHVDIVDVPADPDQAKSTFFSKENRVLYGLSFFLVGVCVLDWILTLTRGSSLFSLQQILLLIAAVSLLALALLVKQIRQLD